MECDICARHSSAKRPFNCPTCVRSELYNLRIELAKVLTEKEDVARRAEAVVNSQTPSNLPNTVLDGVIVDAQDCARSQQYITLRAETTLMKDRINVISEKAKELNKQIEIYKNDMSKLRVSISQQKSDAESAGFGLDTKSSSEIDTVQKSCRRISRRWDMAHKEVIRGRMSLCREASKLAGLRKVKTVEGQSMKEHFEIADKLTIFDLRTMAKADPAILTASLTQVSFLVARVSAYLALQLPAEILLPHNNEPLPTIYMPSSSYANREPPRLETGGQSTATTPMASRTFSERPRPRTLATKKPLAKLAKEDPKAFSMFVEGATLLAWDVAWLCKTQGMQNLSSWTDVCNIGRNLYQLLMADHRATNRSITKKSDDLKDDPSTEEGQNNGSSNPLLFGQYSHGTAHSFFSTFDNFSLVRGWRLQTPQRVIDKVKHFLITDMTGAEWEVLQEMEWSNAGEEQYDEVPVLVKGRRTSTAAASGTLSDNKTRKSGTSGWTKLRSREEGNGDIKSGNTTGDDNP
jgi:Vacuolar sorting 38 and autophagy-related subunit 14